MTFDGAKASIDLYLQRGVEPGSFLLAVLRSDLFAAMGAADESSRANLFQIVNYVYNKLPAGATRGNVDRWINDEAYRTEILQTREAFRTLP